MDDFQESIKGTATITTYVGVNVKDPSHDAKRNSDLLDKITDKENTTVKLDNYWPPLSLTSLQIVDMMQRHVKWLCWWNLLYRHLPSIIFMLGTVPVIYYKQISGYEDRERFVILQIGLDDLQVKQTIGKQGHLLPPLDFCLYSLGLCLSYDRLVISVSLGS